MNEYTGKFHKLAIQNEVLSERRFAVKMSVYYGAYIYREKEI